MNQLMILFPGEGGSRVIESVRPGGSHGGRGQGGDAVLGLNPPVISLADPLVEGEGSIDPLALDRIYEQLADRFLPAVTVRMSRIRFLTAMSLGALVSPATTTPASPSAPASPPSSPSSPPASPPPTSPLSSASTRAAPSASSSASTRPSPRCPRRLQRHGRGRRSPPQRPPHDPPRPRLEPLHPRAAHRPHRPHRRPLQAGLRQHRGLPPYLAATQDEKMSRVVTDRERWFGILMGDSYPTSEASTESTAARLSLPDAIAKSLAPRLHACIPSQSAPQAATDA
jgi:hypothetical protein